MGRCTRGGLRAILPSMRVTKTNQSQSNCNFVGCRSYRSISAVLKTRFARIKATIKRGRQPILGAEDQFRAKVKARACMVDNWKEKMRRGRPEVFMDAGLQAGSSPETAHPGGLEGNGLLISGGYPRSERASRLMFLHTLARFKLFASHCTP